MLQTQHKGKGGQEDKKCPIHVAPHPWCSLFECCSYEAASSESKKRGKNMCNLSQKEGSSLLAVLTESERKMLPKNLPLHAETFSFFLAAGYTV